MTNRPLGRTGFRASILGIGDLADRAVPLETCVATVRRALDFGLNVVDTAPGYEDGYSDTTGYNQPLQPRPRGKFSSGGQTPAEEPQLPRLSVADCLDYTLTLNPDVALLGMSFPNEQDAVHQALGEFRPLAGERTDDIRRRAAKAVEGKGPVWWNPRNG